MGPWHHGQEIREGSSLGAIKFNSDTALTFRQEILRPFWVWDKIRKEQYKSEEYRCGICKCEARGKLDCHEIWEFDDVNRIQRLQGFIALCKLCHAVKHFGRIAMLDENVRRQVEEHFMRVNECDLKTCKTHGDQAMALWVERSSHEWSFDWGDYQTLVIKKDTRALNLFDA
jgi:hypothetical protein